MWTGAIGNALKSYAGLQKVCSEIRVTLAEKKHLKPLINIVMWKWENEIWFAQTEQKAYGACVF